MIKADRPQRAWTLLAATVAAVAACQSPTAQRRSLVPVVPPNTVLVVSASAHVTGTYPAHCAARGSLPDPVCTPGSIRSDMVSPTDTQITVTVCRPGWTATVRPPQGETDRLKTQAMAAYGVPVARRGVVELDHQIPLSLGGSSDVSNLWPEVSDIPGQGFRNSKDGVENTVHAAVCAHRVTLGAAQLAVMTDWTTAERRLGLKQ